MQLTIVEWQDQHGWSHVMGMDFIQALIVKLCIARKHPLAGLPATFTRPCSPIQWSEWFLSICRWTGFNGYAFSGRWELIFRSCLKLIDHRFRPQTNDPQTPLDWLTWTWRITPIADELLCSPQTTTLDWLLWKIQSRDLLARPGRPKDLECEYMGQVRPGILLEVSWPNRHSLTKQTGYCLKLGKCSLTGKSPDLQVWSFQCLNLHFQLWVSLYNHYYRLVLHLLNFHLAFAQAIVRNV